jgi:outer membrane immunogenic protein
MKKILSAALIVAATSVSANAADMSMPSYKAAPMAQSVYNWTGFYLGGTAGGGIANSDHLDPDDFFEGNTKFQEAFGTVGLTAGYNYQFGHTVLGIEGDYNWANVDKTRALDSSFGDGESATTRFRMNEFATLRARGGLAFDQTLIYATAGVAFAHIQNSSTFFDENTAVEGASEDKWKTGLAVGGGVEFALTHNWTLKGEYMLMQFQNSDAIINITSTGLSSCSTATPCRSNYSEAIQVARIGLNYRFGN